MNCSRKNTCVNHKIRCFECGALSNINDVYPKYASRDSNREGLLMLLSARPELLNDSLSNMLALADYLVENGVRVEG